MHSTTVRFLKSLQHAGVKNLARPHRTQAEPSHHPAPPSAQQEALLSPRPSEKASSLLENISSDISTCKKCDLCRDRRHTVPGEGNPTARIMFIGEAPGQDEDRLGRPFVGPAGKLLDAIIEKGMKRERAEVYICNIVKCRPPKNRNPLPAEINACTPYLEQQIDAVRPAVICALGKVAAHWLLDSQAPMSRLRGRTHHFQGIPVIPTYHPSYLLRNPAAKIQTWEDIQKVMEVSAPA